MLRFVVAISQFLKFLKPEDLLCCRHFSLCTVDKNHVTSKSKVAVLGFNLFNRNRTKRHLIQAGQPGQR